MADRKRKPLQDADAELWNAIAAFEKILEALPNDPVTLETLADAYEKVGDRTRSLEYIVRLTNVLLDESDEDGAREMLAKLSSLAPNDPRLKELSERLKTLRPDKVMALVMDDDEVKEHRTLNVASEISFAWNLLQAEQISRDEYSKIVQDLTESSASEEEMPVSTLHALHNMKFSKMNSVIAFASSSCKIPFISLANFDIQHSISSLLPISFVVNRGALLFDLMGKDALVAILNPYDDQLPLDIETITGKRSHMFLVEPDDFDRALANLKETSTEGQSSEASEQV